MKTEEWQISQEEKLRSRLDSAKDASRLIRVLDDHLSQMLLAHNEQCSDPLLQEAAGQMISSARGILSLLECTGEVRVWERTRSMTARDPAADSPADADSLFGMTGTGKVTGLLFWVCLIGGIIMLAVTLLVLCGSPAGLLRLPGALFSCAAGGGLLFLSGLFLRRKKQPSLSPEKEILTQITYDSSRILRSLRLFAITMDQNLEKAAAFSRSMEKQSALGGNGKDLSDQEDMLILFSGLMEAAYSKDGDYALDELGQIRYYLHRHHIELSDDAAQHPEWFESIPSAQPGILRPALVRAEDSSLLKKGLAAHLNQN